MQDPKVSAFLEKHAPLLVDRLEAYLARQIPHLAMQGHIDVIMDEWKGLRVEESHEYWPGEAAFWAAVWSTRHLANESHWKGGTTERDLGRVLNLLKRGGQVPKR